MMVIIEGRWPHYWLFKQPDNLTLTCPRKSGEAPLEAATEGPPEKPAKLRKSTLEFSKLSNKEEGWTEEERKRSKAPDTS